MVALTLLWIICCYCLICDMNLFESMMWVSPARPIDNIDYYKRLNAEHWDILHRRLGYPRYPWNCPTLARGLVKIQAVNIRKIQRTSKLNNFTCVGCLQDIGQSHLVTINHVSKGSICVRALKITPEKISADTEHLCC